MVVVEDRVREVLGENPPALISRQQAAELLSVSRGTLNNMVAKGSLIEVDGTKKLALSDVCKFIASQNMAGSDVPTAEADRITEAMR